MRKKITYTWDKEKNKINQQKHFVSCIEEILLEFLAQASGAKGVNNMKKNCIYWRTTWVWWDCKWSSAISGRAKKSEDRHRFTNFCRKRMHQMNNSYIRPWMSIFNGIHKLLDYFWISLLTMTQINILFIMFAVFLLGVSILVLFLISERKR